MVRESFSFFLITLSLRKKFSGNEMNFVVIEIALELGKSAR